MMYVRPQLLRPGNSGMPKNMDSRCYNSLVQSFESLICLHDSIWIAPSPDEALLLAANHHKKDVSTSSTHGATDEVETHKVMKTLFPIKGKFEICLPLFL